MRLTDAAKMAGLTLWKNPVRTLLTILGLGVGIAAVLTVLTLGSAGEEQVELQIDRLGVNKVWITAEDGNTLALEDGGAVRAATGLSACIGTYTPALVSIGEKQAMVQVCGYDEGMGAVHGIRIKAGRMFAKQEYQGSCVALADETLAEALGGSVLGKYADIGSRRINIVGIAENVQVQAVGASNGKLILPLQTFADTFAYAAAQEMTLNIPGGMRADEAGGRALAVLGEGYQADSLQEEIDAARAVVRIFVMVLACVAAVCILTGAIGVMNILLVSVRERRREIGLMKAIGGTSRQIGLLFLLEAGCYALLGGLLGIVLGWGMTCIFGGWIGLEAQLSAKTAVPALAAAGAAGVLFGVAPAVRAARLAPVDALKSD